MATNTNSDSGPVMSVPHQRVLQPGHRSSLQAQPCRDYVAYGCKDGESIYAGLRTAEENRRELILKAAKKLAGHAENTAHYLDGFEAGMRKAGANESTAMRVRYEVAAIIAAYALAVELGAPREIIHRAGGRMTASIKLDPRDLEIQKSWQGLVNTARNMRNAATNHLRSKEGLPHQLGRGNHTVRKFQDNKFDKLREQLIERTATNQVLDLLDAAILAVANAYSGIASNEIDSLREVEQRIHDKVNAGIPQKSGGSNFTQRRQEWAA